MEKDKKRGPNYTAKEKILTLKPRMQKDEEWDKITNYFNSQTTIYARNEEYLRKFYDNQKKKLRKYVAEDKRETFKTGGGSREIENDPTRNLLLDIVYQKNLFGLDTPFGGDCVNQEEIHRRPEKESLVNRERREEELFDLKKRKLQLDIRLTEMELSAKTLTKLSDT
nr:unnamed protein product [Callosobruchus chinensis]